MKKLGAKLAAIGMIATMAVGLAGCGNAGASGNGIVKTIDISLTDEQYAFGVDKNNEELLSQANEYIAQVKDRRDKRLRFAQGIGIAGDHRQHGVGIGVCHSPEQCLLVCRQL